jgi:hypothetical protein
MDLHNSLYIFMYLLLGYEMLRLIFLLSYCMLFYLWFYAFSMIRTLTTFERKGDSYSDRTVALEKFLYFMYSRNSITSLLLCLIIFLGYCMDVIN